MSPHASFPVAFVHWPDDVLGEYREDGVAVAKKGFVRGDSYWYRRSDGKVSLLRFVCPCGCGTVQAVSVNLGARGWQWNGDTERPTLTPSIALVRGCDWHGFLKDGQWTL